MKREGFQGRVAVALVLICALLLLANEALAAQANVFVYHRFGDDRYPSTNVSIEVFRRQLELLRQNDYQVLSLGQVVERLQQGQALPERCAVLTIDDGYESFASGGLPLLKEFGYPATLFVSTDSVGRPGYLGWEALRRIGGAGIEIGNHSAAHEHMAASRAGEDPAQWRERMRVDLTRSQNAFHEHLGMEPKLFAYPYGEYSLPLMQLLGELGFQAAATQHSGVVAPHSHLFALPRFPMGGSYATFEGFRDKLRMRALPVLKSEPAEVVLGGENPPWLTLSIDPQSDLDLSRLSFFVRGRAESGIVVDPDKPGVVRVRAAGPLTGRRTNYTLTAPAKSGGGWYWYSHLWIRPEMPE